jgi:hypothetical protein
MTSSWDRKDRVALYFLTRCPKFGDIDGGKTFPLKFQGLSAIVIVAVKDVSGVGFTSVSRRVVIILADLILLFMYILWI